MDVKVCIIGAGVAGLKTADSLLASAQFKHEDLIIVEAQDRIGGRLLTDRTSSKIGLHYDLGASWFHDCLSNVVFNHFYEGNDTDVFDILKDGYFDDTPLESYSSAGAIDARRAKLETIFHDIESFCELYFIDKPSGEGDITLKELSQLYIAKYDRLLRPEEKKYAQVAMRYYELWHGVSWDRLSARYAVLEHSGRDMYNKKGYDFLIRWLVQRSQLEPRVRLSTPVRKIYRDAAAARGGAPLLPGNTSGRRCAVETRSGQLIYCDYVVVTVPQSILALDAKTDPEYAIQWQPALPAAMTSALSKIHFGALGKVIFEFDSIWWDNTKDRFAIYADPDSAADGVERLQQLPQPFSFPALAVNCSAVHGSDKGSLLILTQTPLTEYLEAHPEQAWTYFKPMLAKIATDPSAAAGGAPDPLTTITTKWTTNPYIRGSYGACYKGDDPSDFVSQLSGEIDGLGISSSTIRFAGEHTSFEGEGCVHGAWMSAEREAKWILAHAQSGAAFSGSKPRL